MNMQQNANIREYLNQDISNGKLYFFKATSNKIGENRQKALITSRFTPHKDIFLAEVEWLSGMF